MRNLKNKDVFISVQSLGFSGVFRVFFENRKKMFTYLLAYPYNLLMVLTITIRQRCNQ